MSIMVLFLYLWTLFLVLERIVGLFSKKAKSPKKIDLFVCYIIVLFFICILLLDRLNILEIHVKQISQKPIIDWNIKSDLLIIIAIIIPIAVMVEAYLFWWISKKK